MNMYFECKKCFYKTPRKCDMVSHLNKKNKCTRTLESFKYKESELDILSLTRNDKLVDNNNIEKINKCENCNLIFSRIDNLKRHINQSCKASKNNLSIDNISFANNIMNNSNNNNITNNITNNTNIQILNPFNIKSTWSLDHINVQEQYDILKTNLLYSTALEKILENDKNLNILINNDNALAFNNDDVENIELDKLYRLVIGKLNTTLFNFKDEVKKSDIDKNITLIEEACEIANKIFLDYKNNANNIRSRAKTMINDIYNNRREKTEEIFKNLSSNKKIGYF